ncbi:hypothetical protein [Limosilactobacillus mucosae]|uniref:hypothetical protein n=1 Tax=Limosilactobacillus mucosae TaxID=97478 RepID=UPI003EBB6E8C
MQTPRLPKYLMLSSFALLTATTSLIFNDHEIKADTAENTAAAAVSTTVSNTVVLNGTAQTDIASNAVADDTASLSDSASSAAGEQRASSSADVLTEVTTPDTGNVTQSDASWTLKGLGNYFCSGRLLQLQSDCPAGWSIINQCQRSAAQLLSKRSICSHYGQSRLRNAF